MALVPAKEDKQHEAYAKDKVKWVKENAPEELELKKAKEEAQKDGAGSKK